MKKIIGLIILCGLFSNSIIAQVNLVEEFYSGSNSSIRDIFHSGEEQFFFNVNNSDADQMELWISDGTSSGTELVDSFYWINSSNIQKSYTTAGGYFYFYASRVQGEYGFYRVSFTTKEVELIIEDANSSSASSFEVISEGNYAYFHFRDPSNSSCRNFYRANATSLELMVPEQIECAASNIKPAIEEINNRIYFYDDNYDILFEYDGQNFSDVFSDSGIVNSSGNNAINIKSTYGAAFSSVGNRLVFFGRYDDFEVEQEGVFAFDVSSGNLELLVESPLVGVVQDTDYHQKFINHYGKIYFLTADSTSKDSNDSDVPANIVLYGTDGTVSGTQRLYEYAEPGGNPSYPYYLANVNMQGIVGSKIIFYSIMPDDDYTIGEFYSYDMETGNSELFSDSNNNFFENSQGIFGETYFFREDYTDGQIAREVMAYSDGTENNTSFDALTEDEAIYKVRNNGIAIQPNNLVYFAAEDIDGNTGLYVLQTGNTENPGDDNSEEIVYEINFEFPYPLDSAGVLLYPEGWTLLESAIYDDTLSESDEEDVLYSALLATWRLLPSIWSGNGEEEGLFSQGYLGMSTGFFGRNSLPVDELIVSPRVEVSGKQNIRLTTNMSYEPLSILVDSVEFELLLRSGDQDWISLHKVSPDMEIPDDYNEYYSSIDILDYLDTDQIDINISNLVNSDSIQFGFRFRTYKDLELVSFAIIESIALHEELIQTSNETEDELEIATGFHLFQNYPNPFNPSTVISYQIPVNSEVRLQVFDMLGRKVSTLVNERKSAGSHTVQFDASSLSSGMYIYRIDSGSFSQSRKLMLIK